MFKFDFKKNYTLIIGTIVVVLLGIGTGWILSGKAKLGGGSGQTAKNIVNSSNEAGILNANFKGDTATGNLVEGGIGGEGTHHIERDGGASKNVYLTSSVIDLQSFVGKKVEVWGETLAGKKAGWLMDVIKVKVVE
jgi:hypothetical protein